MKKIYALFLLALSVNVLHAQCPIINGAYVNACTSLQNTEGLNELVVFTTTASAPASSYVLHYGRATPPGSAPISILSGANAAAQNGSGLISSLGGCTIVYVTSPATVIPAGAVVVFIPSNFTNNFDISRFCATGTIHIVFIDIAAATPTPKWDAAGTFENDPGVTVRYLQITNGASSCLPNIRSYTGGWSSDEVGNLIGWSQNGTANYLNASCDLVTLPAKLLSFTAVYAGKNTNIAWQTSSEVNAKSFELQRAADGQNFNTVYTTTAAGISSTVKNYAFSDLNMAAGPSYYRLKMIDMDGTVTYSKIARVVSAGNGFVITNVYPSPAVSQLRITWHSPGAVKTVANVYDLAGRMLISKQMPATSGMNYYQLPVGQLPTGTYMLKLVNDGETVVTQFTKQ